MHRVLAVTSSSLVLFLSVALTAVDARQASTASAGSPAPHQAVVNRYCVSCHSERARAGNLVLEKLSADVGAAPEVWEKVVRKLRMQAMPPLGAPRPEAREYEAVVSYLETELDRAAGSRPLEPGRTEALHRLNATEYQNAVRDLLALDIDAKSLLPADTAAGLGFDNMAGVLTLSPALMERYLSAARTVSRLAVGLGSTTRTIDAYDVPLNLLQSDRMSEDLPFGSRGGTAIRHQFPVDGEYVIKVRFTRNYVDYVRGLLYPHQLQIRVDGALVKALPVGGEWEPRQFAPASFEGNINGTADWEAWVHRADDRLDVPVPIRAGARVVGVTFPREQWEGEGMLQPTATGFALGVDGMPGENPSVARVIIEGPLAVSGSGDAPSRRRIFVCRPTGPDEATCAKRILSTLVRRAFRRPVTDEDVRPFINFYASRRVSGADFDGGIQFALEGLLSHPEFILRVAREPRGVKPGTAYRISDVELASRLSFFLWGSIPDDELLALAGKGRLKEPRILERQVRRMLADPKSKSLVNDFVGQWLFVRNVNGWVVDSQKFPDFDDNLRQAFEHETALFVDSQIRADRSVLDLLGAKYTFVNERLARHYGIPGVYGSQFRRIELTDTSSRGGLLGQGSILMVTSYPERTSPVLRGKWILSNLLGLPPNPPPPDVPSLPDKGEGGKPASVRERLERHRKNPVCATCHAPMDPLGFALEHYDAVGAWHATESGIPIDSAGVLPGGVNFEGMAGLRHALLTNYRDQFVRTTAEKLLEYAVGRQLEHFDQPVLRKITRDAAAREYSWSAFILGIARSAPFQMRRSAS